MPETPRENPGKNSADDWWVELYDDLLAESLLVREESESTTIGFLEEELGLAAHRSRGTETRVFDQCCGIGSLAVPMAGRGHEVIGVDQAKGYIERARAHAAEAAGTVRFEVADAFEYVADPGCHGALNWWTSYGYAESDARNHSMLRRAFESLLPGGRFALDVPNLAGVLRGFEADRTDTRETPMGRIEMRRVSRIDLAAGRLLKRWTFRVEGEVQAERDTSLALALPHDHIKALEGVGFSLAAAYAGTDRRPLTIDSPRCVLIAEKPT